MWECCKGTADVDRQVHLRRTRVLAAGFEMARVECTGLGWCCLRSVQEGSAELVGRWVCFAKE